MNTWEGTKRSVDGNKRILRGTPEPSTYWKYRKQAMFNEIVKVLYCVHLSCVDIVEGQVEGKTFQMSLTCSFHLEFWAVSFILSSHPPDKDLWKGIFLLSWKHRYIPLEKYFGELWILNNCWSNRSIMKIRCWAQGRLNVAAVILLIVMWATKEGRD